MQRAILHLDMDAFYASVEQHDHPELAGRPVIVGGSRERGVVCACSYETRPAGVHSAMPMARALQLCPEAVVRPVRMERYREVSRQIFAIFAGYTDQVEPLSIDEAFLDVSGCRRLFGEPRAIAAAIIADVRHQTGLTVSAGVAPNKFLAKLASSRCKPAGLLEIRPQQVDDFLLPLPVEALWGVGRKTAEQLRALGVRSVAELRAFPRAVLESRFGQLGGMLYELCRGEDERPVVTSAEAQSMGAEETFAADLRAAADLDRELLKLAVAVSRRARRQGLLGRKLMLKIKYADFSQVTRSRTPSEGIDTTDQVYALARELLHAHRTPDRPIRLLGIYLAELEDPAAQQPSLFSEGRERARALDAAVDRLRSGGAEVCRATLLEGETSGDRRKPRR